MLFDLLPLCIQHTVIHRIPIMTIPAQALPAQNPFPDESQALHRFLRLYVSAIGLELRPHGSQFLKRMGQQQILALGIHPGSLPGLSDPGPADLQIGILPLNIQISGRTNHFIIHLIDDYKRDLRPQCLLLQRLLNQTAVSRSPADGDGAYTARFHHPARTV